MSTNSYVRSALLGSALSAVLAALTAAPAAAHVTVQPGEAAKGGYAKLAFRVPNESATAGTIKLEIDFPPDTRLASVRTKPMPGWAVQVRKETLDGSPITRAVSWTAQPGVRIGPGEFTEFEISVGPLPADVDVLTFPATQTYDDGRVVQWDAPPAAEGAAEPEHPAPVLRLVASGSRSAVNEHAHASTRGADQTARWVGGLGLAFGVLGLGAAGGTLLVNRRRAGAGGDS